MNSRPFACPHDPDVSAPQKIESGMRPAALRPAPARAETFLEDFGEETTAVEHVSAQLIATTAARGDELDEADDADDDPYDAPTRAIPLDVVALRALAAANGFFGDPCDPCADGGVVVAHAFPAAPVAASVSPPQLAPTICNAVVSELASQPLLSIAAPRSEHPATHWPPVRFDNGSLPLAPPPPPADAKQPSLMLVAIASFSVTIAGAFFAWAYLARLLGH